MYIVGFFNAPQIELYTAVPPIGTCLLPNQSVIIREVSFGDREQHMN